jgi:hypothetical protein
MYVYSSVIFLINLVGGVLGGVNVGGVESEWLKNGVCLRRSKRVCNIFVCCSLVYSRGAF